MVHFFILEHKKTYFNTRGPKKISATYRILGGGVNRDGQKENKNDRGCLGISGSGIVQEEG